MNSNKTPLKDALETTPATEAIQHVPTEGRHHEIHRRVHARVKHHVHRLRQKPDHHKKAIAFGIAFTFTAIIFTFWYFFTLPNILADYRVTKEQNKRLNRSPNVIEGFNKLYGAKDNAASVSDAIEANQ